MKNKFQRLSKSEQKEIVKEFKNSNVKYNNLAKSYLRVKILCIAGIIFGLISFGFDLYMNNKLDDYLIDGFLLAGCVFAFVLFHDTYYKKINEFLIRKSNDNKNTKKSKVKKKK